jgi:hypothetical protein
MNKEVINQILDIVMKTWAVIGIFIAIILAVLRKTKSISIRRLIKLIFSAKKFYRNGIVDIFCSRAEIIKYRKPAKMLEFINEAHSTFAYTGIHFSIYNNTDDNYANRYTKEETRSIFKSMLSRDVSVTVIMWGRNIDQTKIGIAADYYGIDAAELSQKINESWFFFNDLKESKDIKNEKLVIIEHDKLIYNSAFFLDNEMKCSQTFFDIKLFRMADKSLSFQLTKGKKNEVGSLYNRVTSSFECIASSLRNTD